MPHNFYASIYKAFIYLLFHYIVVNVLFPVQVLVVHLLTRPVLSYFPSSTKKDWHHSTGTVKNPTYAIYRDRGYGPTFGGGFSIHISNNANSNTGSYTRFYGLYYSLPSGVQNKQTFLAGSYNFTPDEVEVFYLT